MRRNWALSALNLRRKRDPTETPCIDRSVLIHSRSKYFRAGQRLVDITDCRNLISLQSMIGIIYYLQSFAMMSACYSYICVALATSLRMGLHRSNVSKDLSLIERETRKRIFWVLRTMDTYVTTMLGLPRTVSDEDIDQEMPLEIDDEYITDRQILTPPNNHSSTMALTSAHTRLLIILSKVAKYIYNPKQNLNGQTGSYRVDYTKVVEIENDLTNWFRHLPCKSTSKGSTSSNSQR